MTRTYLAEGVRSGEPLALGALVFPAGAAMAVFAAAALVFVTLLVV